MKIDKTVGKLKATCLARDASELTRKTLFLSPNGWYAAGKTHQLRGPIQNRGPKRNRNRRTCRLCHDGLARSISKLAFGN